MRPRAVTRAALPGARSKEVHIERHRVKKVIQFCYGHRLLNYDGPCRNLHGHNGSLQIEIDARALNPLGMVIDFSKVRDIAKGWVDEHLDHKLLLNRLDPLVPVLRAHGEPLFLMDGNPTAENIAKLIYEQLRTRGLEVARVNLWETPTSCAEYGEE